MKMNTKTQKSGVKVRESVGSRIFTIINTLILAFLALICILPLINILAISLSSNAAATAGLVKLLPVDFTLKSYEYVAKRAAFWKSLGVTVIRCLLGVSLNVIMCVLVAYPLSKDNRKLKLRTVYTWFFFITMLINAGLIPWYMTIKSVHLLGTIWALVLPGAVPVFSVVLMLNFSGRYRRSWRRPLSWTEQATGISWPGSMCRCPRPALPPSACSRWFITGIPGLTASSS